LPNWNHSCRASLLAVWSRRRSGLHLTALPLPHAQRFSSARRWPLDSFSAALPFGNPGEASIYLWRPTQLTTFSKSKRRQSRASRSCCGPGFMTPFDQIPPLCVLCAARPASRDCPVCSSCHGIYLNVSTLRGRPMSFTLILIIYFVLGLCLFLRNFKGTHVIVTFARTLYIDSHFFVV